MRCCSCNQNLREGHRECVQYAPCYYQREVRQRPCQDVVDVLTLGERDESVTWFLSEIKKEVTISPKIVSCHFSYAQVNSIRNVITQTLLLLHEWNLKERQKTDVKLRRYLYNEVFRSRRDAFERRCLLNNPMLSGFRTLLFVKERLVVLCYTRTSCRLRLMYRGNYYAKTSNEE